MTAIEDLFDFFRRWSTLRPKVQALIDTDRTTSSEQMILKAMMDVMDRVGPGDLHAEDDA